MYSRFVFCSLLLLLTAGLLSANESAPEPPAIPLTPAFMEINRDFVNWLDPEDPSAGVQVDSRKHPMDWLWAIRTKKGALKPLTSYTLTMEYRFSSGSGFYHLLSRPLNSKTADRDTFHQNLTEKSETWKPYHTTFMTGSGGDAAFQLHLFRDVLGGIRNLKIYEGDRLNRKNLAAADFQTGEFKAYVPPTGAREFEVERPKNPGKKTVLASEFGVRPENPDNTRAIQKAIDHCRETGAERLLFSPGRYHLTQDDASLRFLCMNDFIFDGGGAVFVFRKKREPNFFILQCERVVFRNFSMDWDWEQDPLGSLVEVAGQTSDTLDLRFVHYPDFPRKDLRIAILSAFDPRTKSVGFEGGVMQSFEFFAGKDRPEMKWLSGNVLRIRTSNAKRFRKGELYRAQHYYYDMAGFVMSNNRHLTVEDVQILSCAGHGFVIEGVQQYWQFQRVRIAPPDNDPRRVITCTADHCHIVCSRGFFKMENCEFSFGADDCLNAHDGSAFATLTGPRSLRFRRYFMVQPGAEIELREDDYSPTGIRLNVQKIRKIRADGEVYTELTFAQDLPKPKRGGFILFNWTYDTRNLIIRNNFFHDNRARGVLILARDVTLEGNYFRHNEMGALKLETGYTHQLWSEGYGVSNIVVRNNYFDTVNPTDTGHDGKAHDLYLGVYLKTDPSGERTVYPVLSRLLFEDNYFQNTFGLAAFISSAGDVMFRRNVFRNPVTSRKTPLPFRAGFFVTHSSDVRIENNTWLRSKTLPDPAIFWNQATTGSLRISGNRILDSEEWAPRVPGMALAR